MLDDFVRHASDFSAANYGISVRDVMGGVSIAELYAVAEDWMGDGSSPRAMVESYARKYDLENTRPRDAFLKKTAGLHRNPPSAGTLARVPGMVWAYYVFPVEANKYEVVIVREDVREFGHLVPKEFITGTRDEALAAVIKRNETELGISEIELQDILESTSEMPTADQEVRQRLRREAAKSARLNPMKAERIDLPKDYPVQTDQVIMLGWTKPLPQVRQDKYRRALPVQGPSNIEDEEVMASENPGLVEQAGRMVRRSSRGRSRYTWDKSYHRLTVIFTGSEIEDKFPYTWGRGYKRVFVYLDADSLEPWGFVAEPRDADLENKLVTDLTKWAVECATPK